MSRPSTFLVALFVAACGGGTTVTTSGSSGGELPPAPILVPQRAHDGATWAVTATNRNADQVIKFEIRMEDLVIYDPKSGEVLGKSEPLPNERARLILNDKCPFPATVVIRQEGREWTGRASHQDQDWTVLLRRLTR